MYALLARWRIALKAMAHRVVFFGRRPFVRSVMNVSSGTAVAQAISAAFSPLVTRLYGPEAYGTLSVFMSIAGVASTIAAMTYPIAIVLPKSDADALGLIRLSICTAIVTSLLVALTLVLFGSEFLAFLNVGPISTFVYLIPIFMLSTVVSAVAGQWLTRKRAFALVGKIAAWQALLISAIRVGLGFLNPTVAMLVITNTFSGFLGAVLMGIGWRRSRTSNRSEPAIVARGPKTWQLATQYRDFPILRTPQVFVNALTNSLPVVMLTMFFGASAVGFYSIACAVLTVPSALIGNSVMQVFYPRITEAIRRGEDGRALIIKATAGMALIGALPFGVVAVAGPMLFALVFGAEWRMAGTYAQWLSIWLFFQQINWPAVSAIPALRLQGGLLIYELTSSVGKAMALYIGYSVFKSDTVAIALFSVFGIISYAGLILWVIQRSGSARLTFTQERH